MGMLMLRQVLGEQLVPTQVFPLMRWALGVTCRHSLGQVYCSLWTAANLIQMEHYLHWQLDHLRSHRPLHPHLLHHHLPPPRLPRLHRQSARSAHSAHSAHLQNFHPASLFCFNTRDDRLLVSTAYLQSPDHHQRTAFPYPVFQRLSHSKENTATKSLTYGTGEYIASSQWYKRLTWLIQHRYSLRDH